MTSTWSAAQDWACGPIQLRRLPKPKVKLSAPRDTPTPTCSGASAEASSFATAVLSRVLQASLRRTSPTAIGRTPPSFFRKGVKFAPQRTGAISSGIRPCAHMWQNRAKADTRGAPRAGRRKASCRCDARKPEGPGAELLGKDVMASLTRGSQKDWMS